MPRYHTKMIHIFLLMVFLGCCLLILYMDFTTDFSNQKTTPCQRYLQNILEMNVNEDSIFFLETSSDAFQYGTIRVRKRTACAIESAALHHPNRSIYMIYFLVNVTESLPIYDRFLKSLFAYPNLQIVYAIMADYVKGTPVEELYAMKLIDDSPFWVEHYSDLLRWITIAKYGGIYMDEDVIVRKPLNNLGKNFLGLMPDGRLGAAVVGFSKTGFGGDFLNNILIDLNKNYKWHDYLGNGPKLLTRWTRRLCKTTDLSSLSNKNCSELRILPPSSFYPIYAKSWIKLFKAAYNEEVFRSTKDSYLVHFWNKLSSQSILPLGSNVSYLILAKENCPRAYNLLYKML